MKLFCVLISLLFISNSFGQFTDVAAATGTNHGNSKDGGVAWADFNNDGCLDLIFNTNTNNAANRTRLLMSDCSLPNPTFTDVTAANAAGLTALKCERSISVGDYNNDGYIDIARNTHPTFEVYLNNGPGSTPAYSFGIGAGQTPNFTGAGVPGGTNVEGFGWMDYNNDGWLDLVLENHEFGIDIYENPADGSANFFHVTPNGATKGFPTGCASSGACAGDYMVLGDYNDDGFVDILARKEDSNNPDNDYDLWTNNGAGAFVPNVTFNQPADGSNKGGVLFCDFDNDGDFDIFWTDNGSNEIYEQTGLNSGNFSATGEPAASAGIGISNTIDGCDCGDIDNDGDLDLFLGGSNAANSYLFINNGGGAGVFDFTRNNSGIAPGGNTEGLAFADYDNDGDLDLYLNRDGGANELWRNGQNDANFLKIHVRRDLGGGVYRDDLGATAVLKDCNGLVTSGIRQVGSVKGHGSNSPAVIHFGLNSGPAAPYLLEVRFTSVNGTRLILDSVIVPNTYANNTVTIISPAPTSSMDGCSYFLPVDLVNFDGEAKFEGNLIEWSTASEINASHFQLLSTVDGENWKVVANVNAAGNSSSYINYNFIDQSFTSDITYYKLKQFDHHGSVQESKVISITREHYLNVSVFPNPTKGDSRVVSSEEIVVFTLFNSYGAVISNEILFEFPKSNEVLIHTVSLPKGIYFIQVNGREIRQLIVE